MLDVNRFQRYTARYEFADGIRDFQTAFWIFITGIYALIVWDIPDLWLPFVDFARAQGTLFILLTTFVVPIGIPVIISEFCFRAANEHIRRRWLWRNTGFIKSKAWIIPRYVLFTAYGITFSVFIGGILLAIETHDASLILRGLYVGIGTSLAYMYGSVGIRLQIPRHKILALTGFAGTLLLALLPLRMGMFAFTLSLLWVILLVLSGIYAMRQVAIQQKALDDAG